jgi:DNA polymerase I-like protein with 3'-5' exonuclease and polymerase domains
MTAATHNGAFPSDARGAAEVYLRRGLAPIPMPTRAKDPGYSGWENLRLTEADLDARFPRGEAHNVGVLNGEPSGNSADVDLDCQEARAAAARLLPATGWVFGRKSSPRSHLIYRTDAPLDKAQEEFRDLDGSMIVEARGTGGLTVFPCSLHKETGQQIVWDRFGEPATLPLTDLLRAVGRVAAAALIARHWPAEGSRQDAARALSGGLLRAGWAAEDVERFVEAVALAAGDDERRKRVETLKRVAQLLKDDKHAYGWPKLAGVLRDGGDKVVGLARCWLGLAPEKGRRKRKSPAVGPYLPFPSEHLPGPLRDLVTYAAAAIGCDAGYLGPTALAVAGSLIGNTRTVRLKAGWEEPPVVWAVFIGDSGSMKTPAYKAVMRPVYKIQKQLRDEFKQEAAAYQDRLAEYKAAKKKHKEDGGDDPGDPPERPVARRLFTNDCTIEKLGELLEDNPRGLLVTRDELSAWLGSFSRYRGKDDTSDVPHWLEMSNAGTLLKDRKTGDRPSIYVERASVCIAGGTQPGVLAKALTPGLFASGLVARLLLAMPDKKPKRWSEAIIPQEVEAAYRDALEGLLALDFATGDDGQPCPCPLGLAPDAKQRWVAFYNDWAKEQAAVEGDLAAAFSKLEAYAARLALIHHVVTCVVARQEDCRPITLESLEAGIALCRWFAYECRRVYATLGETAEERDARRLVELIRSWGGATTARQLQKSNSRKYPRAADAEAALDALVKDGLGRWEEPEAGPKGGRPARRFVLLPTPDTTDTTPDDEDDAEDNDCGPPPDTTPDTTPGGGAPPVDDTDATNTANGSYREEVATGEEVVSVVPGVGKDTTTSAAAATPPGHAEGAPEVVSGGCVGRPDQAPPFLLVTDAADLPAVVSAVEESVRVALDTETTGLDPRTDRVRLLSLATDTQDGGRFVCLIDLLALDAAALAPLWEALAGRELTAHNAAFDLRFLARFGFAPSAPVHCTMLLAQLLSAGTFETANLKDVVQRELGVTIDKEEQRSDWSGELTADQLAYAARDAAVLPRLFAVLDARVKADRLEQAAEVERRCLPAVAWLSSQGVAFDRAAWQEQARAAAAAAERVQAALDEAAPQRSGDLFRSAWNWSSPAQVKEALALLGVEAADTTDATLARLDHPLAALLRRHREASKQATAFGPNWLRHVADDGRVYADWRQMGAASGRMSCGDPNMQQLPRGACRRCVVAPPGRVLVKADYSQVELRIAAKVSGDQAMLDAYARGEDLHTNTARLVLGVADVTKAHRQQAKALNFGLLYGMGAATLRVYARTNYGVEMTDEEAARYREAFFQTYPGLKRWHQRTGRTRDQAIDTRTLAGRRRLGVKRFTEKLNTPVQGTGADGLKTALALLWERRAGCPGAFPVLAVHDEIVLECDEAQAEQAKAWLRQAMLDGMRPLIDPVPVEVEVSAGRTWAGE